MVVRKRNPFSVWEPNTEQHPNFAEYPQDGCYNINYSHLDIHVILFWNSRYFQVPASLIGSSSFTLFRIILFSTFIIDNFSSATFNLTFMPLTCSLIYFTAFSTEITVVFLHVDCSCMVLLKTQHTTKCNKTIESTKYIYTRVHGQSKPQTRVLKGQTPRSITSCLAAYILPQLFVQ